MPNLFPEQRDDSEHLCHNNTKLMLSPTGIIPYPQKQWQINPLSVAVYENWYSHRTCCALLKYVTFSHRKTQNNILSKTVKFLGKNSIVNDMFTKIADRGVIL